MKILFYAVWLIIFSNCLQAQTITVQQFDAYIKDKGYVPLTDKANVPPAIMSYYKAIMDTITAKHPQMKNFYVLKSSIISDSKIWGATIYPLSAIKMMKMRADIAKRNRIADSLAPDTFVKIKDRMVRVHIYHIDDYGGSVGEFVMVLTKATGRIMFYQTQ
jgi:hypothetical protein